MPQTTAHITPLDRIQALLDQPLDSTAAAYLASGTRILPLASSSWQKTLASMKSALLGKIRIAIEKDGDNPTAFLDDTLKTAYYLQIEALVNAAEQVCDADDARPWADWRSAAQEWTQLARQPASARSDDDNKRMRQIGKFFGHGLLRNALRPPEPAAVLALTTDFPHFHEVLTFIAQQCALLRLKGAGPRHLNPILLAGPPGIGKTYFLERVAELFGTRKATLTMSSQSCGFTLAGLDRGWSEARPGLVFENIMQGDSLAPVIVLDEIDKVTPDMKSDPLGPLYTLLEPRSARHFRDEFGGFPIDASQVIWFATANEVTGIPAPLLSRLRVFHIAPPGPEALRGTVRSIFREYGAGLPGVPETIPDGWIDAALAGRHGCLREIRQAIQHALGSAALRSALSSQTCLHLRQEDFHAQARPARRGPGFH